MAVNVFELMATLGVDTSEYEKGLGNAQSMASSFGSGVASACKIGAAAIVAVGTAAVGAGTALVDATGNVAAYGDNIDKMSQKIGISAEAYQEWDAVMQHCGASVDSLQPVMKKLASAAETGDEAFEALGISQEEVANLSQEDLFARVISGLQDMEEGTERTYIATQLLGRGATEFGALLNTSAEDTQAMIDAVHELGGVMSDEAVKAAAKYQDTLQDMTTAFDGLKRGLMSDFMPSITTVMEGLTAIFTGDFDAGIEQMSAGIQDVVANLTEALPQALEVGTSIIGAIAQSIIDNIPTVFPALVDLVENVGDKILNSLPKLVSIGGQFISVISKSIIGSIPSLLTTAVSIVQQVFTGIINEIPSVFAEFQTILPELINIAETFKTMISEMIPEIATFLQEQLPLFVQMIVDMITYLTSPEVLSESLTMFIDMAMQIIMALANGLMEALPVLIEAAPVIIENLVTAIVNNFPMIVQAAIQIIGALTEAILSNLGQIISAGIQILNSLIDGVIKTVPTLLTAGFNLMTEFAGAILKSLPDMLEGGASIIGAILEGILNRVGTVIEAIIDLGASIISSVESFYTTAWDAGVELLTEFADGIANVGANAWQWGTDLIDNFISGIKDSISNVISACQDIAGTIADYLGFSEPDKGPLSNFHTFAPDMVDLFTKGISDNLGELENAASDFALAIKPELEDTDFDSYTMKANTDLAGSTAQTSRDNNRIISLLEELVNKDTSVVLEGDANGVFNLVRKEQRRFYKSTGYSAFS